MHFERVCGSRIGRDPMTALPRYASQKSLAVSVVGLPKKQQANELSPKALPDAVMACFTASRLKATQAHHHSVSSFSLSQETSKSRSPIFREIEKDTIALGIPALSTQAIIDTMFDEVVSRWQKAARRKSREGMLGRRGMTFLVTALDDSLETPTDGISLTTKMHAGEISFEELCLMLCEKPWMQLIPPELHRHIPLFKEHLQETQRKARRTAVKSKSKSAVPKKKDVDAEKKCRQAQSGLAKPGWQRMRQWQAMMKDAGADENKAFMAMSTKDKALFLFRMNDSKRKEEILVSLEEIDRTKCRDMIASQENGDSLDDYTDDGIKKRLSTKTGGWKRVPKAGTSTGPPTRDETEQRQVSGYRSNALLSEEGVNINHDIGIVSESTALRLERAYQAHCELRHQFKDSDWSQTRDRVWGIGLSPESVVSKAADEQMITE